MNRSRPAGPLGAVAVWLALTLPAFTQVVVPTPPAKYDAVVRLRIRAERTERILQYVELTRRLDQLGITREVEPTNAATDQNIEILRAVVPSDVVGTAIQLPNLRTMLLIPAGAELPPRVPVRIDLASGLPTERQRLLAEQVEAQLRAIGFVPRTGYDHRGFSRLSGTFPSAALEELVRDVRVQPAGWVLPESVTELPEPLRGIDAIRIVTVLPDPEGISPPSDAAVAGPPTAGEEYRAKLNPDLARDTADEADADRRARLEVILAREPAADDPAWVALFLSRPNVSILGRSGRFVTIETELKWAVDFARLPEVSGVRYAEKASPAVPSEAVSGPAGRLPSMPGSGDGVTLVIIADDFAGTAERVNRGLPADVELLDLTAEFDPDLRPAAGGAGLGVGTRAAMLAAVAAPRAKLVLVRVGRDTPFQLQTIGLALRGDFVRSPSLTRRNLELLADNQRLRLARERINAERSELVNNFDQDDETLKRRSELAAKLADLRREEQALTDRIGRFSALEDGLRRLRSARVAANLLTWNIGYPADGTGPLSRYLDEQFARDTPLGGPPAVWLQATGDTRGQAWAGFFHDRDGNRVMEFVGPSVAVPPGRWTRELNFLSWQPHAGTATADLPAGTTVRVALQWNEVQDRPTAGSEMRLPLADLRVLALRQRDPSGRAVASDDLDVVARPAAWPQLIGRTHAGSTYEHVIEFRVERAGRYALRVEGSVPRTTLPPGVPDLPAHRAYWDLPLRLFVSAAGGEPAGRPVFADYFDERGGVGIPSDSRTAVGIGARTADGANRRFSARGSFPGQELFVRPFALVPDRFAISDVYTGGTADATALSAGWLAARLSGTSPDDDPNFYWRTLREAFPASGGE